MVWVARVLRSVPAPSKAEIAREPNEIGKKPNA